MPQVSNGGVPDTLDYQYDELSPPQQSGGPYNPLATIEDSFIKPETPTVSVQISEEDSDFDVLKSPGGGNSLGITPRVKTELFIPAFPLPTFEKITLRNPEDKVEQTTVFQRGPQSPTFSTLISNTQSEAQKVCEPGNTRCEEPPPGERLLN